jgi:hypothetical protein
LVWISSQLPTNPRAPFSLPEFCDYRDQNTLFDGLGAVGSYNANLVDSGEPERVQALRLSANIFQLLGVRPLRGRTFVAEDDAPIAMISYGLWSRRYAKEDCSRKMIAYSLSSVVSFTSRGACLSTSFEYPWHFAVSHLTPNLLCICVL